MPLKSSAIERSSPVPLYHQLKEVLLAEIRSGTWKAGDLIPGEQELQDIYGLSRTTVRQSLRELELEGHVIRYRGRGTFVSEPKLTHSPQPTRSLTRALMDRGMTPGWKLIRSEAVSAAADVAGALGVAEGASVHELVRLRLADNAPIGVHIAHVAPAFRDAVDDAALTSGGSLDYLRASVLDGSAAERVIEAVAASVNDAELLGVEPGAPVLLISRQLTAPDGRVIEVMKARYRGDRFEYRVDSVAHAER